MVIRCRSDLESRQLALCIINLRPGAVGRFAHEATNYGVLSTDWAAGICRIRRMKQLTLTQIPLNKIPDNADSTYTYGLVRHRYYQKRCQMSSGEAWFTHPMLTPRYMTESSTSAFGK
jgi:hypothetical protein